MGFFVDRLAIAVNLTRETSLRYWKLGIAASQIADINHLWDELDRSVNQRDSSAVYTGLHSRPILQQLLKT